MDKLAEELGVWLSDQPAFQRYGGMDHFMALGSPTWAFRRDDSHNDTWGSKLEYVPQVDKLFKLEVERHGYTPGRSMGVPYPIAFHPRLAGDVRSWQARVRVSDRPLRWSYAGMPPGTEDEVKETRNLIHKQCSESLSPCQHLDCSVEGACSLSNRMSERAGAPVQGRYQQGLMLKVGGCRVPPVIPVLRPTAWRHLHLPLRV